MMNKEIQAIRGRFIETSGNLSQSLGAGRAIGQIFAHIYFSRAPQTLDDLTNALAISKGSASMCVRQLEQWSALRRVWIKGNRKDHYEATVEFGDVVRRLLRDFVGRSVETSDRLLAEAEEALGRSAPEDGADRADYEFLRRRIRFLSQFRARVRIIWDNSLLQLLLKK